MSVRSDRSVPRDHCLAPGRALGAPLDGGTYGRLFDQLPRLAGDETLLHALGAAGGVCDGTGECPDARVAAGWPFLGQFVAHDITADRSPLVSRADPAGVRNYRTPAVNLECLYGGGPVGSPYLYDRDDPALLPTGVHAGDVPRNPQGVALIGDPRNDVHLFVNQIQVALIHAHNLLVHRLRDDGEPEPSVFDEARRALTWHYQWVLLNDLLSVLVGEKLASSLLREGPTVYRPGDAARIPLEFADAAFRYGHSHYHSLAARDLQRGQATGLPSGEAVARALGVEPLNGEQVGLAEHGWSAETPLWFYVLREADVQQQGDRLGEVGGRIVGEVLVGIVDADPESYRAVDPGWRPTLPAAGTDGYGIADLIRAPALARH